VASDPEIQQGSVALGTASIATWRELVGQHWFIVSALTAGFFFVTFLVYWYLGPQETPYLHHVNQANNFLHGHLDLREEYSRNLNTLEAAYYNDKTYMTHPPMPAILLLPFVAVSGLDTNQALISAVLGGLTAALAFRIFRSMVSIKSAVWLTVMFTFGSTFWYIAAHGSIWYFSHTVGLMFLMLAVYFTITTRNPLAAGLCLGAAFLSRLPMGFSAVFFLLMFSEAPKLAETTATDAVSRGRAWAVAYVRTNFVTLAKFSAGAGSFVFIYLLFNYLRFDDPLEGGHGLSPQVSQEHLQAVYSHGISDLHYIPRHVAVMFEQTPLFSKNGSYVWPSWAGAAVWVTTPALLYAYFPSLRDRRIAIGGAIALMATILFILTRALSRVYWPSLGWDDFRLHDEYFLLPFWGLGLVAILAFTQGRDRVTLATGSLIAAAASVAFFLSRILADEFWSSLGWQDLNGLYLAPFWVMAVLAIVLALRDRDKVAVACWSAILPVGLFLFMFAATGWTQFGYRYATDFYPFLFLLVAKTAGDKMRWDMRALILLGVAVNLWGVLWIYQFDQHRWVSDFLPSATDAWTWVSF